MVWKKVWLGHVFQSFIFFFPVFEGGGEWLLLTVKLHQHSGMGMVF